MVRPQGKDRQSAWSQSYWDAAAQMAAVLPQEGPDTAIANLLRLLKQVTGADAVLIATPEPGTARLQGRAPAPGLAAETLKRLQIAANGVWPPDSILQGRSAVLIDDPGRAARLLPEAGMCQLVVAGLATGGENRGLLIVASSQRGALGEADLPISGVAASLISAALAASDTRREIAVLEQTSNGWRELLGQVSHELRVALTPILTWSQILSRQARLERRWQKAIDVIQRNTRDQARLVDDLLGATGLLPHPGPVQPSRLNLGEQIKSVVEAVKPQADARQVALKIELPGDGLVVDADPLGLRQIVANLLRNAVRNAPRGGFVALAATSDKDGVLLRIIRPPGGAEMARAITPGMNLSLALIRQMVERYGGSLRTDSDPNTYLEVLLPSAAPAAEPAETVARRKLAGLELLVIEDHDDSREALAALLEAHGARVRTASTGEAGIEIALEDRPDVVLCDLAMPGMDGYEVARRLRERLGWQHVTLLALSAHGESADVARARAAGFSAHLLKPVETNRLLEMVEAGAQN
jgi:CheY-like chemotaxis protein